MAAGEAREATVYLHYKEGHRVPVLVRSAPPPGWAAYRVAEITARSCHVQVT